MCDKISGKALAVILTVCVTVSWCTGKYENNAELKRTECVKLGGTLIRGKCLKEIKLEKQ